MVEKNSSIILRPQAQKDLDSIRKISPQAFEDLLEKMDLLSEFPEMGPRMDRAYQGYRQVLCGNYRIVYELISVKRIEVAYIRHLSRQMGLRAV
ncbi:MAG: type II toxin-antitoxin system RelE/ParE family toxin [Deltaproteobacteria bacterium]|nr:type II toxin-antitoxin system RelE/ParE family toxin [Deltaproteobacteria bacterium]